MPRNSHARPVAPTGASDGPPGTGRTGDPARLHHRQVRAVRIHAAVFAGSMVMIFAANPAINLAAGVADEWWAWWSVLALFGWGLGVSVHGLVVRMSRPEVVGSSSEREQAASVRSSNQP